MQNKLYICGMDTLKKEIKKIKKKKKAVKIAIKKTMQLIEEVRGSSSLKSMCFPEVIFPKGTDHVCTDSNPYITPKEEKAIRSLSPKKKSELIDEINNIVPERIVLNKLAKQFHERSRAKGFWDDPRETGTLLMLMVSELSEALEADRKNKHADLSAFDNRERKSKEDFCRDFQELIKDTFEDEIADVLIRLLDFIGQRNIDIERHVELKIEYNQTRPHKHGKSY